AAAARPPAPDRAACADPRAGESILFSAPRLDRPASPEQPPAGHLRRPPREGMRTLQSSVAGRQSPVSSPRSSASVVSLSRDLAPPERLARGGSSVGPTHVVADRRPRDSVIADRDADAGRRRN